jgi:hypothetical protein
MFLFSFGRHSPSNFPFYAKSNENYDSAGIEEEEKYKQRDMRDRIESMTNMTSLMFSIRGKDVYTYIVVINMMSLIFIIFVTVERSRRK